MTQGKYIAVPVRSLPGVDKDGTTYNSVNYTDSRWTRYFQKMPAKIGGYTAISLGSQSVTRNMFDIDIAEGVQVFLGRIGQMTYLPISNQSIVAPEVDITPVGYVSHPSNSWSMDQFSPQEVLSVPGIIGDYLIAAATRNGSSKNSIYEGLVYYTYVGDTLYSTSQMLPLIDQADPLLPNIMCSGGILCSPTIVMAYGSNGSLRWTQPGTFDQWGYVPPPSIPPVSYVKNIATISSTKVIIGKLTPGVTGTSALFWTSDSLERVTFITDPTTSQLTPSVQTLQKGISILSGPSLVQYNQLFYWVGNGQFYFFNGIVNILQNNLSTNFFFDNLDYKYTARIWTLVQPRFGEIWFYWPSDRSRNLPGSENIPEGECDQATVFDTIQNIWFCTPIARTAGVTPSDNPYPILSDSVLTNTLLNNGFYAGYPVWQHDTGLNKKINNEETPIEAYFDTHIMDLFSQNPEQNILIRSRRLQPNFIQQGPMEVTLSTRMFPADEPQIDGPYTFLPTTPKIDLETQQGALLSFRFRTNILDGYFRLGKTIFEYLPGDNVR